MKLELLQATTVDERLSLFDASEAAERISCATISIPYLSSRIEEQFNPVWSFGDNCNRDEQDALEVTRMIR